MNISVIGTGYVGLVTGSCLAEAGHTVTCIDNNEHKVAQMQRGESPIFEPGLDEVMQRGMDAGRLKFTTDLTAGISQAEAIFLALPTPPQEDGSADLTAVLSIAKTLGPILPKHYSVIINKSTVPVGTAEAVQAAIAGNTEAEFGVGSNPEFLREGFAIDDFMNPERIVIGVNDTRSEQLLRKLYQPFTDKGHPLYVTDPRTSELVKYAANSFLVVKIGFMNEIAQLCERMGADVDMVRQAMGADSRIGAKFLYPGIGAGGSCFPKDVRALKHMAGEYDYDFKILDASIAVNNQQQHVLGAKILDHYDSDISGKTFALWGLAFKPNTDDIREAPALVLIDELLAAGAKVVAYDPEAGENVKAARNGSAGLTIVDTKDTALDGADALLIATEWDEFKQADVATIGTTLAEKVIFDGRNIFDTQTMRDGSFTYYSIGRRPVIQ